MTIAEFETVEERTMIEVLEWRFAQLAKSGYGIADAITLATHTEIDLHCASELVTRGCPPSLALRILL